MPKKTGTNIAKVKLQKPLQHGEDKIDEIELREPKSGELRGISMVELIQLKTDAVFELIPRISNPPLTDVEVAELSASDLFLISSEIANFLVPDGATDASPAT